MKKIVLFLLLLFISFDGLYAKDYIFIDNNFPKSKKKALVILNGVGDSKKYRKIQLEYFKDNGMDVFIPDYKQRSSLDESLYKFSVFYDEHEIDSYKEVNFMCYIVGGYILNRYIEINGKKNIKKIIYDRSPIQERAAIIGVNKLPLLTKIKFGQLVFDFSKIKLNPLKDDDGLEIGVIIENQATRLMRAFEKISYKYGPYSFDINKIEKNYDDYFHTWLDHDLMYKRFDVIGSEILYFYKNGKFTKQAKRNKYNWDPFKKIRL